MGRQMGKEWERYSRLFTSMSECSYKCTCGKTVMMTNKVDKVVCTNCGKYVFKNKKDEFNFRMQERLK